MPLSVLTGVFQHVFLQIALVGEGPLAESAHERFLPGVGAQMALIVVLAGEPGVTLGALQPALCRQTTRHILKFKII